MDMNKSLKREKKKKKKTIAGPITNDRRLVNTKIP